MKLEITTLFNPFLSGMLIVLHSLDGRKHLTIAITTLYMILFIPQVHVCVTVNFDFFYIHVVKWSLYHRRPEISYIVFLYQVLNI